MCVCLDAAYMIVYLAELEYTCFFCALDVVFVFLMECFCYLEPNHGCDHLFKIYNLNQRIIETSVLNQHIWRVLWNVWMSLPETHIQRQAALHDCLCRLLGDGYTWIEIVYIQEKIFCTGLTRATKAGQKSLVPRWTLRTNQGRTPLHLYSVSPHMPQF